MFKSTRWKGQNSKIKVMFQMQFQATQVPKLKGKGLMVSLIPADVGKPTARLEKTVVVEGTCTWEHPIYEMVKLIKHQKTETYKEKIYYFNVATGSSKARFVGEVGVNFADFAETTEPLQLSLPLTASDSGPILHVFIQKMQRTDELREFEENESPGAESFRSKNQTSDCSEGVNILDFTEDDYSVNSQNTRDPQSENNRNLQEHTPVRRNSKSLDKTTVAAGNHVKQRSSTDWSLGSLSDRSMADALNSPQHNFPVDRLPEELQAPGNAVDALKSDICRLERQAEVSEMELESLRKQVAKENKRGQDLSRQIGLLKEEKYALQKERDQAVLNDSESSEDLRVLLDEIRQELRNEKGSNKALRLQLRKTEESNSELCIVVKDLDTTIEQKDREISDLSDKVKESQMVKDAMKIEELYAEMEIYRKDKEEMQIDMKNMSLEYELLRQENDDLSSQLEQTQIEQMKMQNEYSKSLATIKEYELQVGRLEEKITKQALVFSESLDTISELETHVKSLEAEMASNEQQASEVEFFRGQARNLKEALERSHEELSLTKNLYEQEIQKLGDQIKQISLELEECRDAAEEKMPREWVSEREELETECASLRKEAKKLQVEAITWRGLMDEKKVIIGTLQSELKTVRGDYNELQESLLVMKLEKDKLRKEVSRLEHNLREKEKAAKTVDQPKHMKLHKEGQVRTSNHSDEQKIKTLLSEISSLDGRNKHMESELKEMQEKYLEISLRFAEVEGERQQLVMALRNLRNGKK